MRLGKAVDLFLDWRSLERDASDRSNESYGRILWKLAERDPEASLADYEGKRGTVLLREPELDDYVFTVEVEQWISSTERRRRRLDPKERRSSQALGRMVKRVCGRAGIPEYSPHPLRHGFGNRFLRESNKDLATLQALYGHSRPDTTQSYTDELSLDEQAEALRKAVERRRAQASPHQTTPEHKPSSSLETEEWRRRESNPRPRSHRAELLQA
jgi:integrase